MTFIRMENDFPGIRDELVRGLFVGWRKHLEFLLSYIQMIRVRSTEFVVQKGQDLADSRAAIISGVDHTEQKITHKPFRRLTGPEIKNATLANMQYEFRKGADWLTDFHWQIRMTWGSRL